jgi:predicted lipoprotein with Yx(FWY)xxD motif
VRSQTARRVLVGAAASCAALSTLAGTATAAPRTISVASAKNASLGKILVTAGGRTLYHVTAEPKNVVKCTGTCAQDWPPLLVAAGVKPVAGPGVRPSLLGTLRRPDGKTQVTYAGMPLYLYSGDKKAGSAEGQGIGAGSWLAGAWYAVAPTGTVVKTVEPGPSAPGGSKPGSGSEPAPGMTCY